MIEFTTKIPPSVNHMYKNKAGGGKYMAPHAEQWFVDAGWDIKRQCKSLSPMLLFVELNIELFHYTKIDIDNICKATLDLLKMPQKPGDRGMGIIEDDEQIIKLVIDKHKVDIKADEKMTVSVFQKSPSGVR